MGPHGVAFIHTVHQWTLLTHGPVISNSQILTTGIIPPVHWICRCSEPVMQLSKISPCQTRSNPYICSFFLFLTLQLWEHSTDNNDISTTVRCHIEKISVIYFVRNGSYCYVKSIKNRQVSATDMFRIRANNLI